MIKKLKSWWRWHKPIITTPKKQFCMLSKFSHEIDLVNEKSTWAAINPVIHSLKELRKNTWDVERVDHSIKWLKDNFEVAE